MVGVRTLKSKLLSQILLLIAKGTDDLVLIFGGSREKAENAFYFYKETLVLLSLGVCALSGLIHVLRQVIAIKVEDCELLLMYQGKDQLLFVVVEGEEDFPQVHWQNLLEGHYPGSTLREDYSEGDILALREVFLVVLLVDGNEELGQDLTQVQSIEVLENVEQRRQVPEGFLALQEAFPPLLAFSLNEEFQLEGQYLLSLRELLLHLGIPLNKEVQRTQDLSVYQMESEKSLLRNQSVEEHPLLGDRISLLLFAYFVADQERDLPEWSAAVDLYSVFNPLTVLQKGELGQVVLQTGQEFSLQVFFSLDESDFHVIEVSGEELLLSYVFSEFDFQSGIQRNFVSLDFHQVGFEALLLVVVEQNAQKIEVGVTFRPFQGQLHEVDFEDEVIEARVTTLRHFLSFFHDLVFLHDFLHFRALFSLHWGLLACRFLSSVQL